MQLKEVQKTIQNLEIMENFPLKHSKNHTSEVLVAA